METIARSLITNQVGLKIFSQMLAVPGGGGLGAERDRQVRLHSVSTDLELGLPPSIPLPDGEELPYGSSARIHIRDSQQESEIYQKCIRAPPNRTVLEGESPPPYRSASAGALSPPPHDWAVVRSNSVSNRSPPTVQVPAGKRLSALTMVPCLTAPTSAKPKPRSPPLL